MTSAPDDPRAVARAALPVLRTRVDQHFARALAQSPDEMQCREGFDRCCHVRLSVFSLEAERIAAALAHLSSTDPELRAAVRRQADDPAATDRCAMLVRGRCAIYDERPLICRSHGVPVRVEAPGEPPSQTCCPLNFTQVDPPASSVLRLEALNQPLVVMARMYDAAAPRVELAALARASDR